MLRPFWRYYGGKWRMSARLPPPQCSRIVEPFAGSAGYSLRYPDREVILVERDPTIAELWRWLIRASASDVLGLPLLQPGQDVASLGLAPGPAALIGFWCGTGRTVPGRRISTWSSREGSRAGGAPSRRMSGWSAPVRERIASQVEAISHWSIIEGEYLEAPTDRTATYFVDPPYQTSPGRRYRVDFTDHYALGVWLDYEAPGQIIACDQAGATWRDWTGSTDERACVGVSREVHWHRPLSACPHRANFNGYRKALCVLCGEPVSNITDTNTDTDTGRT